MFLVLIERVLLSSHNICFGLAIRKKIIRNADVVAWVSMYRVMLLLVLVKGKPFYTIL